MYGGGAGAEIGGGGGMALFRLAIKKCNVEKLRGGRNAAYTPSPAATKQPINLETLLLHTVNCPSV